MDLTSLIHFLTDRSRNLSSKAIFIILSLSILIIIDNTFSFSYYYNTSQKVSQLKDISVILADTSLPKVERKNLTRLRSQIIEHKTFKDQMFNYLTNFNFNNYAINGEESNKAVDDRNSIIHFLTSSWWISLPFLLVTLVLPFAVYRDRKDILNTILGFITVGVITFFSSLVLSKLFSLIPLIKGNPIYNYLLNFGLSSLILIILILLFKDSKPKEQI